jgi:hypothetical protein
MTKTPFYSLLLLVTLSSCGTAIKTLAGFKNPKVEEKEELLSFFADVLPSQKTYFMTVNEVGNKMDILNNIVLGLNSEILLFNSSTGEKYWDEGTEECGGIQMQNAFKNFNQNYFTCKDSSDLNLSSYIEKIIDVNGKKIEKEELPKADYYIFQNWNKYSGSKKKLEEELNWLLDLKKKSDLNVAIIFVNGDMLEDWGLEKNGELPIKFRKEDKQFTMTFGELPLKNKQHND